MLTYYDGEISVDKKYAKQLVEAFNTMTSLIETCEEEVLNSNTDGKAAIYFVFRHLIIHVLENEIFYFLLDIRLQMSFC